MPLIAVRIKIIIQKFSPQNLLSVNFKALFNPKRTILDKAIIFLIIINLINLLIIRGDVHLSGKIYDFGNFFK
jgi:hypothetical protein